MNRPRFVALYRVAWVGELLQLQEIDAELVGPGLVHVHTDAFEDTVFAAGDLARLGLYESPVEAILAAQHRARVRVEFAAERLLRALSDAAALGMLIPNLEHHHG